GRGFERSVAVLHDVSAWQRLQGRHESGDVPCHAPGIPRYLAQPLGRNILRDAVHSPYEVIRDIRRLACHLHVVGGQPLVCSSAQEQGISREQEVLRICVVLVAEVWEGPRLWRADLATE